MTEIEVIESRSADWCWRCHPCDTFISGLTEAEAKCQASDHENSHEHVVVVVTMRRGA